MVSCWASYIHIEPLTTLRAAQTTAALTRTIEFFRTHTVELKRIRMDNQKCSDLQQRAKDLGLTLEHVAPFVHSPNRAERAIRTAKNHSIAVRAGFHPDCPTALLDKCLPQIELILNLIHPYEYDPRISAHEGIYGQTHDFNAHPLAPMGQGAHLGLATTSRNVGRPWRRSRLPKTGLEP
jgi:hypothetical protein